jgi:plasmid stabilization system protein ParE
MRVEYTRRAVADLRKVSSDNAAFGQIVVSAIEARIRDVIAHIAENPEAAVQVAERPGVRVIPLLRYPYKIFYRFDADSIRILHIRHTARRPWTAER